MAGIEVTDSTFSQEVLSSDIPVLVDFWAPWCGPCRALAPTLENIASEKVGQIKLCKVNIDENSEIAGQFGIRSIPTVLLFKEGQNVGQVIGNVPRSTIEDLLKKV